MGGSEPLAPGFGAINPGVFSHPFDIRGTFLEDLGIEITGFYEGRSELVLIPASRHLNLWGVVHGGVVMSLLDVAMALAGRSLEADAAGNVTVEMKTSFLQPARGELRARGLCRHRSTTLSFCEGELCDASGHLLATASGTFKYIRARDAQRLGIRRSGHGLGD